MPPRIAVIHHLQQPFLGNAAAPLGEVEEHFGTLPDLDDGRRHRLASAASSPPGTRRSTPEAELIREAVAREIPFLGVCLGAQLLAYAHGGEVARLPRRLVTWAPLQGDRRTTRCSARSRPMPTALHWNEDGIEPPPGATELLQRPEGGRAEGFRIGRLAWGVQFHPEVDARALDGWYADWGSVLEPAGVTEAGAREADARHLPGQAALSTADLRRVRRARSCEAIVDPCPSLTPSPTCAPRCRRRPPACSRSAPATASWPRSSRGAGYDVMAIDPKGGDGVLPGRAGGPRRAAALLRRRGRDALAAPRRPARPVAAPALRGAAPRRPADRRRVRRRRATTSAPPPGGSSTPATRTTPPTTSPRCASTCTPSPTSARSSRLVRRSARPSPAPTSTAGTSTPRCATRRSA